MNEVTMLARAHVKIGRGEAAVLNGGGAERALSSPATKGQPNTFHTRVRVLSIVALGLSACSGGVDPIGAIQQTAWALEEKIAFSSTREAICADPTLGAQIYLMNPGPANPDPVRLTNTGCDHGNGFPAISPSGQKIAFDRGTTELLPYDDGKSRLVRHSELYVMAQDGSDQTHLTRGSSASWSSDGRWIAFHASASGTGQPINPNPGAATSDSDIFVANVDDLLAGVAPTNITNNAGNVWINEDADWSPDGQKIVFTRKNAVELDNSLRCLGNVLQSPPVRGGVCDYPSGEIWVMDADGSNPMQLTANGYEERAPSWSPDGTKFVYMCRVGGSGTTFQLCVMNADGSGYMQLTNNGLAHLTASFSPDGGTIIFHSGLIQLFTMPASGGIETQLTNPPGLNGFADWGRLKVNFPGSNSQK